jgi:hypothetical protein
VWLRHPFATGRDVPVEHAELDLIDEGWGREDAAKAKPDREAHEGRSHEAPQGAHRARLLRVPGGPILLEGKRGAILARTRSAAAYAPITGPDVTP